MKKIVFALCLCISYLPLYAQKSLSKKEIAQVFALAEKQYSAMSKVVDSRQAKDKVSPRTTDSTGNLVLLPSRDWTSGFYPGILWLLFEYTGKEDWKQKAQQATLRIEGEKFNTRHHDLGFMIYGSFGHGLRLANLPGYKDVIVQAAKSLSTRYRPSVKAIRSWDFGRWQYPVIIDNMMNLEMLFAATRFTGDSSFYRIAVEHANTTLANHFREDGSSYHVVNYDTLTGKPISKETHQGYANSSAWARGQAWGLYGYTLMYRETGKKKYLDQANKIAAFLLNHPNLPSDKIPYWDFNAPEIPSAKRDASAGAINASALLELSKYVDKKKAKEYRHAAVKMLQSLLSKAYLAEGGTNSGFLLKHSVGYLPARIEVDVPLIYADYYLLEALLRFSRK